MRRVQERPAALVTVVVLAVLFFSCPEPPSEGERDISELSLEELLSTELRSAPQATPEKSLD